ncbi:nucleolus protein [Moniliophthora roreri MCA 2997]|uniref:25S rRNA adenine-N(1) methyltransferase n=2 Tax=Moniliophthora roreri TaxID=221103 RepID=V2Y784_MONRO|nr:nucleolus protein [Moniliophthora roreri MCA 2997]
MPKIRKKKAPITGPPSTASSKPESSRHVIRKFHVLLKRQAQLQKKLESGDPTASKALTDVRHEIDELGGLDNYQRMSAIGQGNDRGCGSEKVLIRWLKEDGMHKLGKRLKLLEVGALKPDNYESCSSWIETTPIDLNSRHPAIMEQDFLLMDENEHRGNWDIISLSLVVNFVPDAANRGRMLCLAHHILRFNGLIFVALPLPCLLNSRYLDLELFNDLMSFIGFKELRVRWKKGGKMIYWLYRKQGVSRDTQATPERFAKKSVLRRGDRNNFAIIL